VSAIGGVVQAVVDMLSALHARAQREEP
jgi:hypothetical protein